MDWDYPFDKPEGAVLLMGLFSNDFYVKSWSSISGILYKHKIGVTFL